MEDQDNENTKYSSLAKITCDSSNLLTSYLHLVGKSVSNTNLSIKNEENCYLNSRNVLSLESLSPKTIKPVNFFQNELTLDQPACSYIEYRDDYSEESYESTDESDVDFDTNDFSGIPKRDVFHTSEVVWAKRTLLPWFPAIIINPLEVTKEIKDLIKRIGAKLPSQEKLNSVNSTIKITDDYHLVLLFNKKKSWMYLPESRLRPFCKENDELFISKANYFSSSYRKQLKKAYEKAKKFAYKSLENDHNINVNYDTINQLLNQLIHL